MYASYVSSTRYIISIIVIIFACLSVAILSIKKQQTLGGCLARVRPAVNLFSLQTKTKQRGIWQLRVSHPATFVRNSVSKQRVGSVLHCVLPGCNRAGTCFSTHYPHISHRIPLFSRRHGVQQQSDAASWQHCSVLRVYDRRPYMD